MIRILNDREKLLNIVRIACMQLEIHDLHHNMDLELAFYHHLTKRGRRRRIKGKIKQLAFIHLFSTLKVMFHDLCLIIIYSQFTKDVNLCFTRLWFHLLQIANVIGIHSKNDVKINEIRLS